MTYQETSQHIVKQILEIMAGIFSAKTVNYEEKRKFCHLVKKRLTSIHISSNIHY